MNIQKVPSEAMIWGQSTWGGAKWGDGSHAGLSVNEIITNAGNNIEDALIAVTAAGQADIFVTEDKKLATKVRKAEEFCKIYNTNELVVFLTNL